MAPRKPKIPKDETKVIAVAANIVPPDNDQDAAPAARARVVLKKKDFVDRAAVRAGIRKSDARLAIDATLATLAEALGGGQDLILPPLGRIRVAREKATKKGRMLMLRLQLGDGAKGDEPLADAAD